MLLPTTQVQSKQSPGVSIGAHSEYFVLKSKAHFANFPVKFHYRVYHPSIFSQRRQQWKNALETMFRSKSKMPDPWVKPGHKHGF
jgi:hypothetical protein